MAELAKERDIELAKIDKDYKIEVIAISFDTAGNAAAAGGTMLCGPVCGLALSAPFKLAKVLFQSGVAGGKVRDEGGGGGGGEAVVAIVTTGLQGTAEEIAKEVAGMAFGMFSPAKLITAVEGQNVIPLTKEAAALITKQGVELIDNTFNAYVDIWVDQKADQIKDEAAKFFRDQETYNAATQAALNQELSNMICGACK